MLENALSGDHNIVLTVPKIEIPSLEFLFQKGGIPDSQLNKYKEAGTLIGKANWTIPDFMPIPFLCEIVDDNRTEKEIDTYFTQCFLENDGIRINDLFQTVDNDINVKYKQAFLEAKFNFKHQNYISCTTILFPIIEGTARGCNGHDKDEVNVEGKRVHDIGSFNAPTTEATLKSVNIFLNNYFESGLASSEIIIKRNTLLHGECMNSDKFTCIRLINCISSILRIKNTVEACECLKAQYQVENQKIT